MIIFQPHRGRLLSHVLLSNLRENIAHTWVKLENSPLYYQNYVPLCTLSTESYQAHLKPSSEGECRGHELHLMATKNFNIRKTNFSTIQNFRSKIFLYLKHFFFSTPSNSIFLVFYHVDSRKTLN